MASRMEWLAFRLAAGRRACAAVPGGPSKIGLARHVSRTAAAVRRGDDAVTAATSRGSPRRSFFRPRAAILAAPISTP